MGLTPNIQKSGRIARAITGVLTIALGVAFWFFAWPEAPVIRTIAIVVCLAAGVFQLYEARKSWCVMRSCGIRTPM